MHQLIDLTATQMKEYLSSIQQVTDYPEISASLFYL